MKIIIQIFRSNSGKPSPSHSMLFAMTGQRSPNPSSGILARQDLADAFRASIYNTIHFSAATTGAIGNSDGHY